jgi:Zn finger protein HypA/HybF involved in hydrogenase expression
VHDYHAVKALVERLRNGLGGVEAERVGVVRIRADATLSAPALEQAYEMLTQDTPLEGSRLVVEEPAGLRLCETCGTSWTATHDDVAGHLLICPSCGALSALEGTTGLEVLEITDRRDAEVSGSP